MANKSTTVTIPLEEYKELLLKDKPLKGNDGEMLERILTLIESHLKYTESDYYSNVVMKHVKIDDSDNVIKEIMQMIKYLDFDRYMKTWNKIMSNERERKAQEEKIKQMNEAKEIGASKEDKE